MFPNVLQYAESTADEESRCSFPPSFQGDWLLMENSRPEYVTVDGGILRSDSSFGHVICKAKHAQRPVYKVVSAFHNGW